MLESRIAVIVFWIRVVGVFPSAIEAFIEGAALLKSVKFVVNFVWWSTLFLGIVLAAAVWINSNVWSLVSRGSFDAETVVAVDIKIVGCCSFGAACKVVCNAEESTEVCWFVVMSDLTITGDSATTFTVDASNVSVVANIVLGEASLRIVCILNFKAEANRVGVAIEEGVEARLETSLAAAWGCSLAGIVEKTLVIVLWVSWIFEFAGSWLDAHVVETIFEPVSAGLGEDFITSGNDSCKELALCLVTISWGALLVGVVGIFSICVITAFNNAGFILSGIVLLVVIPRTAIGKSAEELFWSNGWIILGNSLGLDWLASIIADRVAENTSLKLPDDFIVAIDCDILSVNSGLFKSNSVSDLDCASGFTLAGKVRVNSGFLPFVSIAPNGVGEKAAAGSIEAEIKPPELAWFFDIAVVSMVGSVINEETLLDLTPSAFFAKRLTDWFIELSIFFPWSLRGSLALVVFVLLFTAWAAEPAPLALAWGAGWADEPAPLAPDWGPGWAAEPAPLAPDWAAAPVLLALPVLLAPLAPGCFPALVWLEPPSSGFVEDGGSGFFPSLVCLGGGVSSPSSDGVGSPKPSGGSFLSDRPSSRPFLNSFKSLSFLITSSRFFTASLISRWDLQLF